MFFIVYFSALAGMRALDAKLVQMAQVVGANERDVARHIVFPGAVPYIFTGLRIAMPYSIGGAVIAELISANRGLGYLMQLGAMNFDTTGIFVALAATDLHRLHRQLERQRGRAAAAALAPAVRRRRSRRREPDHGRAAAPRSPRSRASGSPRAPAAMPSPWVIQDLSFSVADGEFLTIIGPSGSGKTTLLNMIAQIDTASGGEVRFQSQAAPLGDPKALNPGLSCQIGYVTQEDNLLPWRTTLRERAVPARRPGPAQRRDARARRDADPRRRPRRLREPLSA